MVKISAADLTALAANPVKEERCQVCRMIGDAYVSGELGERERQLAESIFDLLSWDIEQEVRATLSHHLRHSNRLPRDLALRLARDVDEIALPMLKASEVLNDEDLISILSMCSENKAIAVAGRKTLSEPLCDAVIDTGFEAAVETMVLNDGAKISDNAFLRILDQYAGSDAIKVGMVNRKRLPEGICAKLAALISEELKTLLLSRHEIDPWTLDAIMFETRASVIEEQVGKNSKLQNLERLVKKMHSQGRLGPQMVFRALELGDKAFFEFALSTLAGVAVRNVQRLLMDVGDEGFYALYCQSRLPGEDYQSIRYLVDVIYHQGMRASQADLEAETMLDWVSTIDLSMDS